jgi:hypothetical protein
MKNRVVGGSDWPSKACFCRGRNVDKVECPAKKIIVVRHLFPLRIFSFLLFGLAAKVEVGVQTPILDRPFPIEKNRGDAA